MASSSSNAQNEAPTAGRVQEVKTVRVAKWYFGGVAGSMAACVTHPLDLLKVRDGPFDLLSY